MEINQELVCVDRDNSEVKAGGGDRLEGVNREEKGHVYCFQQ